MSNIGAVLIANNTDRFNYEKLARISADKIERNLNIPTTIINVQKEHNQRYVNFGRVDWLNMGRTQAYELSPYDRTLLIDADMFVHTNTLTAHLNSNVDFAIARQMYDPTTGSYYVQNLGKSKIEQTWATIVIFNKSTLAKSIFDLAQHVLDHYRYYSLLYNFKDFPLRNDYAFSIACHILGGYGQKKFDIADYSLVNCDFNTDIKEINGDNILVTYNNNKKKYLQRIRSDVHIQNKSSLFGLIDE
jgi:hypothetical protein